MVPAIAAFAVVAAIATLPTVTVIAAFVAAAATGAALPTAAALLFLQSCQLWPGDNQQSRQLRPSDNHQSRPLQSSDDPFVVSWRINWWLGRPNWWQVTTRLLSSWLKWRLSPKLFAKKKMFLASCLSCTRQATSKNIGYFGNKILAK